MEPNCLTTWPWPSWKQWRSWTRPVSCVKRCWKIAKLWEDLQLSGATTCHAGIVRRILSCSMYSFNRLLKTNRKAWTLYVPRACMLCIYIYMHVYTSIMYTYIDLWCIILVALPNASKHRSIFYSYTAFWFENDSFRCYWDLAPLQGTTDAQ